MAGNGISNAGNLTCKLKVLKEKIENELDGVMKFWLENSHDASHGGFHNCLDKNGQVYDTTKYGWLQGRQVWMYCKLYNTTQKYHTEEILAAARKGGDFLQTYFKRPEDNKCYFATTCDGKPIKMQRTIFCECFYIMAMTGLYQATNESKYKDEAISVLSSVLHWIHVDDTSLGRPKLTGSPPVNKMSIPMMVICVLNEVCDDKEMASQYEGELQWAVNEILKHVQRNGTVILENVDVNGHEIPGCEGRLINPGHAIEAGWFLLNHARACGDDDLKRTAIEKFIELPFAIGWDFENSGLYYFLDADGFSPTQLEWNMKLWWPHCEALIAFLMAYKETKCLKHFESFCKVIQYTWTHFKDDESQEWFGYLNEKGEITHRFKGGPFKGCFHVPRALFMCSKMIDEIITLNCQV
ncbi:N-acylglucosamine 2-epimerase-like [Dendronephthya gigantea]|uniref:N-acylglucosamine 2-epimerase-like n=1 Tax=Dendronephthya gigantea TaxID=151771 RepID=UPI00106A6B34|nr:N-acylglucosamine 2-epimerase-like [Dendronephthya gigantea]